MRAFTYFSGIDVHTCKNTEVASMSSAAGVSKCRSRFQALLSARTPSLVTHNHHVYKCAHSPVNLSKPISKSSPESTRDVTAVLIRSTSTADTHDTHSQLPCQDLLVNGGYGRLHQSRQWEIGWRLQRFEAAGCRM